MNFVDQRHSEPGSVGYISSELSGTEDSQTSEDILSETEEDLAEVGSNILSGADISDVERTESALDVYGPRITFNRLGRHVRDSQRTTNFSDHLSDRGVEKLGENFIEAVYRSDKDSIQSGAEFFDAFGALRDTLTAARSDYEEDERGPGRYILDAFIQGDDEDVDRIESRYWDVRDKDRKYVRGVSKGDLVDEFVEGYRQTAGNVEIQSIDRTYPNSASD